MHGQQNFKIHWTGISIAECGRKRDVNKCNMQEEDMSILLEEN